MTPSDLEKGKKLYDQIRALNCALDQMAPLDLLNDYQCLLAVCPDGSGSRVDMSGCYVARKVYEATRVVLEEALKAASAELEGL